MAPMLQIKQITMKCTAKPCNHPSETAQLTVAEQDCSAVHKDLSQGKFTGGMSR
jgi:hypothetical protein